MKLGLPEKLGTLRKVEGGKGSESINWLMTKVFVEQPPWLFPGLLIISCNRFIPHIGNIFRVNIPYDEGIVYITYCFTVYRVYNKCVGLLVLSWWMCWVGWVVCAEVCWLWEIYPSPTFKGAVPQNIFILVSSRIGHKNSLKIVGLKRIFKKIGKISNFNYFLVGEPMSPLHVRSKVGMAPFPISALLPSMCGAKSRNLLSTCMGAMQTWLCTLKGAMQSLLHTWSGYIVSGTQTLL